MSKHTPGPWHVDRVGVDDRRIRSDRLCIALVTSGVDDAADIREDFTGPALEANADLLAAAPELYEALCSLTCIGCEHTMDSGFDPCVHCKAAHAAIAKAEGR